MQITHAKISKMHSFRYFGLDDSLKEYHLAYCRDNVAETFVENMVQVEYRLITILRNPKPLKMSTDKHSFQATDRCFICLQGYDTDRDRGRYGVPEKFRGAAHNACNRDLKQRKL